MGRRGQAPEDPSNCTTWRGRVPSAGAFWGLLFGLLFFVPLLGMAIGAATGGDFIKKTREQVTPGTSALFVMSRDAVLDKVKAAFEGQKPELLFTNLSDVQEKALREAFAE